MAKKKYELLKFKEGIVERIKANSKLCDLIMEKLNTDSFGLYRMFIDNSQSLMNYAILKTISKSLSKKIEQLVEEKK